MQNKWLWALVPGLVIGAAGCPDVEVDPDETASPPIVEFDPANRVIPFPNNLLLDPMTGKVNLPASCNESPASMATRVGVLNQLDGFGTFEVAMSVTFTEMVDPASLTDRVKLYRRATGMTPVDPSAATAIPVITIPGMTIRNVPSASDPTMCDPDRAQMVSSVTIVPLVPLEQKSVYTVALLSGITTAGGAPFIGSSTWQLVRDDEPPVTFDESGNVVSDRTPLDPSTPAGLASLQGLDLLWKAHAQALAFLTGTGLVREDILLAWEFKTQTVTDPLDPAVATSPAAMVNTMPLTGPADGLAAPISIAAGAAARTTYPFLVCTTGSVTPATAPEPNNTQCYLKLALGGGLGCTTQATCELAFAVGTGTCAAVGCAAVGDVLAGRLRSKQYQTERPNAAVPAKPIPGPWNNPVTPTVVKEELLSVLITIPAAAPPTAAGYNTAIYQHGLGSSRTTLFAIAPQLAATGFAAVAIDAVAHDSRAVQNSVDPAKGCATTPSFSTAPQCFSGFLSPDLGTTRDNIRQTVLDQQGLVAALKACGTTMCGALQVDPAHITYLGISLGGIIGSITTAVRADLTASVLNVPGVGWVDILENTQTLAIKCTLVDGLIDAGIVMGEKWNPTVMPNTGLCTTDAWKAQPGYRQFSAIGRWVLDPADPANFTRKLAAKKFLIQEVVGDTVVPNIATDNEGRLVGLTAMDASCGVPNGAPPPPMLPSTALTTMPTASKFVKYTNLAPGGPCTPGNTFEHASLLRPAPTPGGTTVGNDGRLGTQRLQTDALYFLAVNK